MFEVINFFVFHVEYFYILYFLIGVLFLYVLTRLLFKRKKETFKKRYNTNLPNKSYKLIYTDQKQTEKKEGVTYGKILYSEKYDITGKPDYLYKKGNDYLPVELKSGKIGEEDSPREKDLMQLVMYFLIIEDLYGVVPTSGHLIYSDAMFVVNNTKALRKRIKIILKEMREMLKTGEQQANPSYINCRYCVCRETVCEYTENK